MESKTENTTSNIGLLTVKTANNWIILSKNIATPKMLFNQFWFEGELCILFADTNLGKSILAVQIGNAISKGEAIPGFILEAIKQRVLYFDFELSSKQFENRYSLDYSNHFIFDANLIRVELNPDAIFPEKVSFDQYLNNSIEESIIKTGAKVLIIDNLTFFGNGNEQAKDALPLMKHLKALKTKHELSILSLAHTPKRDLSKPLTKNDLQGSKMLMNFCDSAFTIGESFADKAVRYLKQIKSRNSEILYDYQNVIICQIEKPNNFLKFSQLGFGNEQEHLKPFSAKDKSDTIAKVKALSAQGRSQRQISSELAISLGSVNKYLNQ